MNYFRVKSALIEGIQAVPVRVECVQSRRLPYLQILGGSAGATGELRERVIAAVGTIQGGKFRLPARRFTVEVLPGARELALEPLDLAVAVAILGSAGLIPAESVEGLLVCGRLGLDGSLAPAGQPAALRRLLREGAYESALLPWAGSEALSDVQLRRGGGFRSLAELVAFLRGEGGPGKRGPSARLEEVDGVAASAGANGLSSDRLWSRLAGQELGRRAIEICAAGTHHLLLPGPAAARADFLAQGLSLLLPPLAEREAEEVRGIYALAGMGQVLPSRPFHALGSRSGLPVLLRDRRLRGVEEILLAHHGVLFVDQACDRDRELFPALLQPMLQGTLSSRLRDRRCEVPAEVIVVAATPGCGCGAIGDARLACVCRPTEAKRFASRWRKLLRYPFDLCMRLTPERERIAGGGFGESADRVASARGRMRARQGKPNGRLGEAELLEGLPWGARAGRLWEALEKRSPWQRQGYLAAARVAATICDLRGGAELSDVDVLEALHYFPGAEGEEGAGKAVASASVPEMNSTATP